MFILVDSRCIHSEKRIREPTRYSRIAKIPVDDKNSEDGEEHVVAETVEAVKGVQWPYHTVGIRIEERDVLLEDSLVFVVVGPGVLLGTVG